MLQLEKVKEDARKELVVKKAMEIEKIMNEVVEPFIEKMAEKYKVYALASRQERAEVDDKPEVLDLSSVRYRETIEAVQCNILNAGWHIKAEGDKLTVHWFAIK